MAVETKTAERETVAVPIHAGVRIGHVHLKVADLDRALKFYCGVLGFQLMQKLGPPAAFIYAGGYHHHIGLNTWESRGAPPPPVGTTGLYHSRSSIRRAPLGRRAAPADRGEDSARRRGRSRRQRSVRGHLSCGRSQ